MNDSQIDNNVLKKAAMGIVAQRAPEKLPQQYTRFRIPGESIQEWQNRLNSNDQETARWREFVDSEMIMQQFWNEARELGVEL